MNIVVEIHGILNWQRSPSLLRTQFLSFLFLSFFLSSLGFSSKILFVSYSFFYLSVQLSRFSA